MGESFLTFLCKIESREEIACDIVAIYRVESGVIYPFEKVSYIPASGKIKEAKF